MSKSIEIIDVGGVKCYLLEADDGFVLIDTDFPQNVSFLMKCWKKHSISPEKHLKS